MMIFVMILFWFMASFKAFNIKINVPVERNVIRETDVFNTAVEIKLNVLKTYRSNRNDRRELIVNLLRKLYEYEDPGLFLEQNSYIHEYIFNRECI